MAPHSRDAACASKNGALTEHAAFMCKQWMLLFGDTAGLLMRGDLGALERIAQTALRHNQASKRARRSIAKSDAGRTKGSHTRRVYVLRAPYSVYGPQEPLRGFEMSSCNTQYGVVRSALSAYTVSVHRTDKCEQRRAFHVYETSNAILIAPRREEAVSCATLLTALHSVSPKGQEPQVFARGAQVLLFTANEALEFPLFNAEKGTSNTVHATRIDLGKKVSVFALCGPDLHAGAVAPVYVGLERHSFNELQNKAVSMLALVVREECK